MQRTIMANATYRNHWHESSDGVRPLMILATLFFIGAACAYFATASWIEPIPRDGSTLVVGRDFLNFWMYGRAAAMPDPGRWYDLAAYQRELAALLGADYPGQNWSYPPSIMIVAAPFGSLSYLQALLCWTALGLGVFLVVARRHLSGPPLLIVLMFSPAVALCLISGQSSLLTAAMLIGIFAALDRKPVFAGVLIGFLTLKPQLGLLFPVLLAASGRWRTFAAAAATALAIAGMTAALFGSQAWIDYVLRGIPTQNLVLADPNKLGAPFMPTIFMNMRIAGASYQIAMAVQSCFSVLAVGAVFWAYRFRREADPQLLSALFLACSIFGLPYLLSYDTLAMTFAALTLLAAGKLDGNGPLLARLMYWLPVLQLSLGVLHIPGAALVAPAFALYVLMQLKGHADWMQTASPALLPHLR